MNFCGQQPPSQGFNAIVPRRNPDVCLEWTLEAQCCILGKKEVDGRQKSGSVNAKLCPFSLRNITSVLHATARPAICKRQEISGPGFYDMKLAFLQGRSVGSVSAETSRLIMILLWRMQSKENFTPNATSPIPAGVGSTERPLQGPDPRSTLATPCLPQSSDLHAGASMQNLEK